jgi:ribonuclease HI
MSIFMILIGLGLLKCLSGAHPMDNKLTINVDVRFCAQSGANVSGTVIRDHMGTIVATTSTVLGRCSNVEEAEATAIWTGLKLAINLNLEPDILESDCVVAISAVNSN